MALLTSFNLIYIHHIKNEAEFTYLETIYVRFVGMRRSLLIDLTRAKTLSYFLLKHPFLFLINFHPGTVVMDSEDAFTTTNLVKASLPPQNNDSTEKITADESKDNTEITTTTTTSYQEEPASVPVNNEIADTNNAPLEEDNITLETSTLITTTTDVEKSKNKVSLTIRKFN